MSADDVLSAERAAGDSTTHCDICVVHTTAAHLNGGVVWLVESIVPGG